jgi:hypothetical protein
MSLELFRGVGVWSGCWVVRHVKITGVTCNNTILINHFNVILMNCNY